MIQKKSLANLKTLISSIENSIGNALDNNGRMNNEEIIIHQKEDWSHHSCMVLVKESRKRKTIEGRKQKTGKNCSRVTT